MQETKKIYKKNLIYWLRFLPTCNLHIIFACCCTLWDI